MRKNRLRGVGFGAGVVLFAMMGLARAAMESSGPTGLAAVGWKIRTFSGKEATAFVGRNDGAIEVKADRSVALLYRAVRKEDGAGRILSWRWRVDKTVPPTDLSRVGRDDRPIAVHVWFAEDPKNSTVVGRFARGALSYVLGIPVSGRVLTYVWGGIGQRGDKLRNPHTGVDGVMVILRPGDSPLERWFTEKVDVVADFAMAFGSVPSSAPRYIAVSGDSDDTGGRSRAAISGLAFTPR